mmetsp:Transcript_12205/g.24925  ORF Transcript_12205/g.24925 Transcript_12205/m.24925 type:complete len:432 (-) Transcript_12205:288-1583(-)
MSNRWSVRHNHNHNPPRAMDPDGVDPDLDRGGLAVESNYSDNGFDDDTDHGHDRRLDPEPAEGVDTEEEGDPTEAVETGVEIPNAAKARRPGRNDGDSAASSSSGDPDAQLPAYYNHPGHEPENLPDDFGNGSDISSADKYADRNSDPGVNADYDLPMLATPLPNKAGLPPSHGLPAGMTADGNLRLPPFGDNPLNNPHIPPSGAESVSLGTATQTHEVRMPMLLSTFKPATGCTNASDFIVRCFVARLRSGITVVKHGRSRWCKSRLRILHVHPDGRSLSWKPALGEPSTNKRPPKLDLSTCKEVRHAWSPDPENPMFTGTPILRQKCEAANAHKSFALIFPKRTVDITAVTADQCKVLMEGFSALCFRLQVANAAANTGSGSGGDDAKKKVGEDAEEDRATASVTLTNNSTMGGGASPSKMLGFKKSFR